MNVQRFLQAGAVWGWPRRGDPLTEARDRYDVTGAPRIVESPWGLALSLDGSNDYVTLRDSEEFPLRFDSGSQDFSIATWIYPRVDGDTHIFDKRDGADDGWLLYYATGGVVGFSLDHDFIYAPAPVGAWHSVIAVVDRSTLMKLYVNGIAAGTTFDPAGEVMATTTLPRIGASSFAAGEKFNGDIAGILIFDRILTPAECLALASPGKAF